MEPAISTELRESLPPEIIEEQMNRLLDQADAMLPEYQIKGSARDVSLLGTANLLNRDGQPLFDRPLFTDTVNGSFFDLAGIRTLRRAKSKAKEDLEGYTLATTMEPSPLVALLALQSGVVDATFATFMGSHPELFRNPAQGISNLQTRSYWPYALRIAPPSDEIFKRGSRQLDGFRRSEDTGFRYDPGNTPRLNPNAITPETPEFDFSRINVAAVMQQAIGSLSETMDIAREAKTAHDRLSIEFVGDFPIVSTLIDVDQIGEELIWHATSDQKDKDSSQHAEIKTLIAEELRRGKGGLKGKVIFTTLEPCAMCTVACHQAGVAVMYGISTEDLKREKPRLFNSKKIAMEGLAAQEDWPFPIAHQKAPKRFGREVIKLMSLYSRDKNGLYFLES